MEVWVVDDGSGYLRIKSKENAEETAKLYKDAKVHHLVEVREKVWVVRDRGVFFMACETRKEAEEMAIDEGWTVTREWLGGEPKRRKQAKKASGASILKSLGDPRAIDLVDLPKLGEKVYGIPPSAWVGYDPPTPYTTEANPEPSE